MICCQWWRAPRVEVPDSTDVNHVCTQALGHRPPCACACGAVAVLEGPSADWLQTARGEAL